jgi:hypothetical protein
MPLLKISSYIKSRSVGLITEGKISSKTIEKALGPEFKNHNLAREVKRGLLISGSFTSGYLGGSSGNTNSGNINCGIRRSSLEDLHFIAGSGIGGLSTSKKEAMSSAEIITNNSSVVYTASGNENQMHESPGTLPIVQAVSTKLTFGTMGTSVGGLVISATGTVMLTASEVPLYNVLQMIPISGLLQSTVTIFFYREERIATP